MPRTPIPVSETVEHLSILDENGVVDPDLDPGIAGELLVRLHRYMVLGRRFDAQLLSLQRQGRIGTFPPVTGQEASSLGVAAALRNTDWMVPAFRETPAELWRGRTLESVILGNNGYNEGGQIDPDVNNFPVSIPVGSQMLHAVGLAWAIRYRGKDDVAATFFGDGATSEGDFHEAMNFAGVYRLPVVFVCQNNQWAISIPRKNQTLSPTLAQKAVAYGFSGIQVDGNDILAVYAAASEAVERGRKGQGPTLIECVTYRMMMHTTADDPKRYRTEEEVGQWRKKDPISRFQIYLKARGLLADADIDALETEVDAQIREAVARAESSMKTLGNPLDMFSHMYAELPVHLRDQRAQLEREVAERPREVPHG